MFRSFKSLAGALVLVLSLGLGAGAAFGDGGLVKPQVGGATGCCRTLF